MKNITRQRFRRRQPASNPPQPLDASGVQFDPSRHVAPDQFTQAGLFKLQPGKRRQAQ